MEYVKQPVTLWNKLTTIIMKHPVYYVKTVFFKLLCPL